MSLFRIGQFAALTGLSAKALRLYDELGLLSPEHVDPSSRYRLYSAEQLFQANLIQALRRAGIPLEEMGTPTRRSLEVAREMLEEKLRDDERMLSHVKALLELETFSVAVKTQPAMQVVSIRDRLGTYDDLPELTAELVSSIPECSVTGVQGALWHSCVHDGIIDCEAFVECSAPRSQVRGRARERQLASTTMACVAVSGDDTDVVEDAYTTLYKWLAMTSHAIAGTRTEWYLPRENGEVITEVRIPFS